MPLSLNSSDVKVLAGIASIIAGLLIVIAGIIAWDVAIMTFGAGLLGAPGVVSAVSVPKPPVASITTTEEVADDERFGV